MTPTWDNGVTRLYHADARRIPLADESVHCVVTSPPYWNLRDYGLAPSVWGGDSGCPHYWSEGVVDPGAQSSDDKSGAKQPNANRRDGMPTSAFCGECGAWLGALGLEPTVGLYVAHIVEIFREVWRALRKDGTCWINLGDSYSGRRDGNLKPKDLVGMPWRVAFALRGDGWWLRSPGIWEKPNPMPESVTDRLTTSHEYVFMLTKSGARLYWAHLDRPGVRIQAAGGLSLLPHGDRRGGGGPAERLAGKRLRVAAGQPLAGGRLLLRWLRHPGTAGGGQCCPDLAAHFLAAARRPEGLPQRRESQPFHPTLRGKPGRAHTLGMERQSRRAQPVGAI